MDALNDKRVTWHFDVLPESAKKTLDLFSQMRWLRRSRWYLAGGTALALQAGHRSSVDLDFFTPQNEFSAAGLLKHFSKDIWSPDIVRQGTVYGKLLGTKVSFIAYPFFVARESYHWYGAVRILDLRDIAVMKIIAISQRGRKRDFIDLYWYCLHREPLSALVHRLADQYPAVAHDYHHILKSLTYFTDAEDDPMPKLFFQASWKDVKKFFKHEVVNVAKETLKLT